MTRVCKREAFQQMSCSAHPMLLLLHPAPAAATPCAPRGSCGSSGGCSTSSRAHARQPPRPSRTRARRTAATAAAAAPMHDACYLGMDFGTSGARATVIDGARAGWVRGRAAGRGAVLPLPVAAAAGLDVGSNSLAHAPMGACSPRAQARSTNAARMAPHGPARARACTRPAEHACAIACANVPLPMRRMLLVRTVCTRCADGGAVLEEVTCEYGAGADSDWARAWERCAGAARCGQGLLCFCSPNRQQTAGLLFAAWVLRGMRAQGTGCAGAGAAAAAPTTACALRPAACALNHAPCTPWQRPQATGPCWVHAACHSCTAPAHSYAPPPRPTAATPTAARPRCPPAPPPPARSTLSSLIQPLPSSLRARCRGIAIDGTFFFLTRILLSTSENCPNCLVHSIVFMRSNHMGHMI